MPVMSPREYVKADLVEWIKAFDEGDDSAYKTIGVGDIHFEFDKHDTEKLSVRLVSSSSNADFKKLPDLVQKKVANLESAACMLYHELCYEAKTGKGHGVAEKRNLLYVALKDLLLPQNFASGTMAKEEEFFSKSWIKDHLLAILLEPSSAPATTVEQLTTASLKATKEWTESAGSLISRLFGNGTSTKRIPSTQEEVCPAHQEHPGPQVPSLALSASTTPESKRSSFLFTKYSGIEDLPSEVRQSLAQLTLEESLRITKSSTQMTHSQLKLKQE